MQGRQRAISLIICLLLIGSGVIAYQTLSRPKTKPVDLTAVMHANNRGVGFLEHLDKQSYAKAVTAFEEVVSLAPDWLPGQTNLGIALMNLDTPESLARARQIFAAILQKSPDDPYAHFCLGIIMRHESKPEEIDQAIAHFESVTKIDPSDAAAWYWLGSLLPPDSARAIECLTRANKLDPYLRGPIYGLAMSFRATNIEKAKQFLDEQQRLDSSNWFNLSGIKYTEMGRYATAIGWTAQASSSPPNGPIPLYQKSAQPLVTLAPGIRWAQSADFAGDKERELLARIWKRFGASIVALDYNRDGHNDLLLLNAVVENGKLRNLLLRNDGNGKFADVTSETGLKSGRADVACTVADFDNDGYPDLFITGIGEQRLLRNTGSGRFEDVSQQAGLDKITGVCLGSTFVDLDQDGDLDLCIARYCDLDSIDTAFKDKAPPSGGGLLVYLNVGEAPAKPKSLNVDPPPLRPKFQAVMEPKTLIGNSAPTCSVAVTDLELDKDMDLVIFSDHQSPSAVLNNRLLRFERASPFEQSLPHSNWNGACVLDANHDGLFDLFVVGAGQYPVLLLGRPRDHTSEKSIWYERVPVDSPQLIQAQAIDVDLDGFTDIVGLTEDLKPMLLHSDGSRLLRKTDAFGNDQSWPKDIVGVLMICSRPNSCPDLFVWSRQNGLERYASLDNGNHGLQIAITGHRHEDGSNLLRCNADGKGTTIISHVDDLWTTLENTTLYTGLGQSSTPLVLGLGRKSAADLVRLRWPDNTWQAEFNQSSEQVVRIGQTNRKTTSCPILFTWNGSRFVFVTDFLGAGSIGEALVGGGHRLPRPEESVKIEADQLRPANGEYVLKIAEPMDEITYLDRLQLIVVDHPGDISVYPDERFASAGPQPTQHLLTIRERIFPRTARNHRGEDITNVLRDRDREMARDFFKRTWLGLAEEHAVELDFGDRLKPFGHSDKLYLCLAGWTDYAYPESFWAAAQAGFQPLAPTLEKQQRDGSWQRIAEIGFPAGLPRLMTFEVTGKLGGEACLLRIRTNLGVYWDQIFVAPVAALITEKDTDRSTSSIRVIRKEVKSAELAARGCMQEFSPDGRPPTIYDYDRLDPIPAIRLAGSLTRFGDVTGVLGRTDDCFVIFGPGDELTARFAAADLPPLPNGWQRSFVLKTWGYCKDAAPFTAHSDTIEPLPFRAMSNYPYGKNEKYLNDAAHRDYLERYNTRKTPPANAARFRWRANTLETTVRQAR